MAILRFLELFCVSRTGVADPNIAHRKRSTFYIVDEGETEEGEHGFWVIDEETGEEGSQVFIQRTNFGFLALRVHTLSADCTADHLRKQSRRAMVRKEKDQDPASARGQKVKVMQHGTMTSKTQLSGKKEKARRARKE